MQAATAISMVPLKTAARTTMEGTQKLPDRLYANIPTFPFFLTAHQLVETDKAFGKALDSFIENHAVFAAKLIIQFLSAIQRRSRQGLSAGVRLW